MVKILSIIIPSYNMEQYLPYCLDSVLLIPSVDDIEVLIINDGSSDRTSEIAHEFSVRFPNTIKVIDKENGNYGSCINYGLMSATGKYVRILDADDSFNSQNFEKFIEFLRHTDADLIISSYAFVNENRCVTGVRPVPYVNETINFEDATSKIIQFNLQMHSATYMRKVFEKLDYHQTEGISYTDTEWIFVPLANVYSVAFFSEVVYLYLLGRNGQTMAFSNPLRSADHIFSMAQSLIREYKRLLPGLDSSHNAYFISRLKRYISSYYNVFLIRRRHKMIDALVYKFDCQLRNESKWLYDYLDSLVLSKYIPFRYIRHWRKYASTGRNSLLLVAIKKLIK